jgi:enolase
MPEVVKLEALEILDSRGNPTLSVTATLSNGIKATGKFPPVHRPANGKQSNFAMETKSGTAARAY